MKTFRLKDMIKGWFVGNFSPAALHSEACEVAIKHYKAGDKEQPHYHGVATELTAIVSGSVVMLGRTWQAGDIVLIEPGEVTSFEALTDAVTVVVKLPSVKMDKYPVEGRS
jgi:quercetin dioxygenase-like cupin family protein